MTNVKEQINNNIAIIITTSINDNNAAIAIDFVKQILNNKSIKINLRVIFSQSGISYVESIKEIDGYSKKWIGLSKRHKFKLELCERSLQEYNIDNIDPFIISGLTEFLQETKNYRLIEL